MSLHDEPSLDDLLASKRTRSHRARRKAKIETRLAYLGFVVSHAKQEVVADLAKQQMIRLEDRLSMLRAHNGRRWK